MALLFARAARAASRAAARRSRAAARAAARRSRAAARAARMRASSAAVCLRVNPTSPLTGLVPGMLARYGKVFLPRERCTVLRHLPAWFTVTGALSTASVAPRAVVPRRMIVSLWTVPARDLTVKSTGFRSFGARAGADAERVLPASFVDFVSPEPHPTAATAITA